LVGFGVNVAVGGTGVFVGGTGVLVGGTGVLVGAMAFNLRTLVLNRVNPSSAQVILTSFSPGVVNSVAANIS